MCAQCVGVGCTSKTYLIAQRSSDKWASDCVHMKAASDDIVMGQQPAEGNAGRQSFAQPVASVVPSSLVGADPSRNANLRLKKSEMGK